MLGNGHVLRDRNLAKPRILFGKDVHRLEVVSLSPLVLLPLHRLAASLLQVPEHRSFLLTSAGDRLVIQVFIRTSAFGILLNHGLMFLRNYMNYLLVVVEMSRCILDLDTLKLLHLLPRHDRSSPVKHLFELIDRTLCQVGLVLASVVNVAQHPNGV